MILPKAPATLQERSADAPRWYRVLVRFRFALAGLYFLTVGFFAFETFFHRWLFDVEPPHDLAALAITAAVFFGMQALLLLGAPHWRHKRPTRFRRMAVSLTAGALMAALLTFGFLGIIVSLLRSNFDWFSKLGDGAIPLVFLIGIPWAFWLVLFVLLWSQRWEQGFGKMYRLLLAGTWLELLITIPVDVSVRRRTNCYCDEGTFFSLVIGVTMAFWTFGPGIVFLFLSRRSPRDAGTCAQCGYDLRGLTSSRCPECGTPFEKGIAAGEKEG
jgi:hypothetical protein